MSGISLSLFDLFKVGPGPSSSHTIGPMKAGASFRREMENLPVEHRHRAARVEVQLFGSLAATGLGHGTHRAILGGLLGWSPEDCDTEALQNLLQNPSAPYELWIPDGNVLLYPQDLSPIREPHHYPYSNTLRFLLRDTEGTVLLESLYYSVGGGFVLREGEDLPERPAPPYAYRTLADFGKIREHEGLSLAEIVLENEKALSGLPEEEVCRRLDQLLHVMEDAVERGLHTGGLLPGPLRLRRKAPLLLRRSFALQHNPDHAMVLLNAYALAASEENAAGHRVVTAPTSGSSGILPAVVRLMRHHAHMPFQILREGLLAAGVVGFLAKTNASIAGAEVGCQGEVGVASAMAAAFLAQVNGYNFRTMEVAAEIALEHHLGMTCDPVGGYVQIPCIERNAMGAVKAYNAYLLASCGDAENQKVSLDQAIAALAATGQDMCPKYKETAEGGLAACFPPC